MSHLITDRLAAIADDTPTPDEATHLAGCWDCRAEVAAYRRLARMAAMAPAHSEPLSAWSNLAPQLRAEGIIVDAQRSGGAGIALVNHSATRPLKTWSLRIAAGLALLVGGGLAGRATATDAPVSFEASLNTAAMPVSQYQSPDEAIRALTVAQQQYQSAAAFLASRDSSSRFVGMNQASYEARLAALDEIAATTRAALYRAPQDPLLNQYYLTTLGAREATLREIGAAMPNSRRLERY
jgi:hypothetical protein